MRAADERATSDIPSAYGPDGSPIEGAVLRREWHALKDALRKAEAQKERCAGLTAGEWRAFFLQTQNQWAAAEDEVKRLREVCRETAEAIDMFGWRYEGNRFMAAELREAMEACRRASS